MDGLFTYLSSLCTFEDVTKSLHALIHADDTLIISTDRNLFFKKCNCMMDHFEVNILKLNLLKSSYLIINVSNTDHKCNIHLNKGVTYKKSQIYLGVIVSDCGLLKKDVKKDVNKHIKGKKENVIIKFANFCSKTLWHH